MTRESCTTKPLRLLMPAISAVQLADGNNGQDKHDSKSQSSRRCGLAQCRQTNCNLSSHRHFASLQRQIRRSKRASVHLLLSKGIRLEPKNDILDQSVLRIERQTQEHFPDLSVKQETLSMLRELAQHYFTSQIDRLIQEYSPHLDRKRYKATMVDHAMSNDIFCVCIAANGKTDMLMRNHIQSPDRSSELVYATTAHVLRKKLDNFRPQDIDWVMVLVVALAGFDMAFQRIARFQAHREALNTLMKMKGGVQKVGHTKPYVLNADRFLAMFTGQYPLFEKTPFLPIALQCEQAPSPYGEALRRTDEVKYFDGKVLDLCHDICQLIHLMECSKISFVPRTAPAADPSVLLYFLYERDRLHCEWSWLYTAYHENQKKAQSEPSAADVTLSKSRCVLIAVLMVGYAVVHGDGHPMMGPYLATQLKSVLERQTPTEWDDHVDVLLWLLVVVAAAVPKAWPHHTWAVEQLMQLLGQKFDDQWPPKGWKDDLLSLLKGYVWSERLDGGFEKLCLEMVFKWEAS